MSKEEQSKKIGQVIAKAWNDDRFKERLLKQTNAVLKEEGIDVPAGVQLQALEDTDTVVHFVIPAKPRMVKEGKPWPVGTSALGCNCWQGEAWH